ncbi:hypothetical protein HPB50_020484 [Hyalomma asiaticum]|uniref:Uncharacterized protein n=1 Tax=Hyalomma asiaticum TaxID=266040 RepID=A0ACB7T5Q6_HYAAI|nr:hypothetical protein HPB50_020484 [Hyalomma asiaticum]
MPKSCCVPRCKSNAARNSDLCYHELPAKKQLRDAWLRHISRQGNVKGSHWVCSIHFKEEDYKVGLKRKVLRPTAVPTVSVVPCIYAAHGLEETPTRSTCGICHCQN